MRTMWLVWWIPKITSWFGKIIPDNTMACEPRCRKRRTKKDKRIRIVFGFRDVFTELGKESAETWLQRISAFQGLMAIWAKMARIRATALRTRKNWSNGISPAKKVCKMCLWWILWMTATQAAILTDLDSSRWWMVYAMARLTPSSWKTFPVLAATISVWVSTWSRFFPCWVSGSLPSMITMTAIIIKVQRWAWMWLSVIW